MHDIVRVEKFSGLKICFSAYIFYKQVRKSVHQGVFTIMKITFIGGGSLRLLPIIRGIFTESPEVLQNGEIRLADLKTDRAQAVAEMIRNTPEYKNVNCRVSVFSEIDPALEGTDVLYLTMAAVREPSDTQALFLGKEYGYISSDQLSINGAFLALRLGGFMLTLARKLEKLSPNALMLIFPNPVSVYSCMVNTYTKIRALGICAGFNNHRWDLSRMCGRDQFDPAWDVVAAGVNHCSFILRGTYKGEDIFDSLLPRVLTDDWKCPDDLTGKETPLLMRNALNNLYNMFRKYKTMVFSTESDGLDHIFAESAAVTMEELIKRVSPFDPVTRKEQSQKEIEERFAAFIELSKHPESIPWNAPGPYDSLIRANTTDISIPILKALSGFEKMRIVASRPNRGAVAGLPDNGALEYTMDIFKDEITPVENQYIPSPFQGLIASLSEFQTLQADAIAQQDPAIFAAALDAYPIHRLRPERKAFFRKMFEIYDDLDPIWKKSLDHLL